MRTEIESINIKEVLKYLAYRGSEIPAEFLSMIQQSMDDIIDRSQPKYIYRIFDLERNHLVHTTLYLQGEDVKKHLNESHRCILMAATLGIQIDNYLRTMQIKDMTRAIILDSCASAAIESVCNQVEHMLADEMSHQNLFLTDRFSPGYGDMPIQQQRDFCSVLNTNRSIGLTVSSSGLLIPRKSVTALMGIAKQKQAKRNPGCESCRLFYNCPYRKAGKSCVRQQ